MSKHSYFKENNGGVVLYETKKVSLAYKSLYDLREKYAFDKKVECAGAFGFLKSERGELVDNEITYLTNVQYGTEDSISMESQQGNVCWHSHPYTTIINGKSENAHSGFSLADLNYIAFNALKMYDEGTNEKWGLHILLTPRHITILNLTRKAFDSLDKNRVLAVNWPDRILRQYAIYRENRLPGTNPDENLNITDFIEMRLNEVDHDNTSKYIDSSVLEDIRMEFHARLFGMMNVLVRDANEYENFLEQYFRSIGIEYKIIKPHEFEDEFLLEGGEKRVNVDKHVSFNVITKIIKV